MLTAMIGYSSDHYCCFKKLVQIDQARCNRVLAIKSAEKRGCEPDTLTFDTDSISVLRSCFKQRSKEHTLMRLSRRLTCLDYGTRFLLNYTQLHTLWLISRSMGWVRLRRTAALRLNTYISRRKAFCKNELALKWAIPNPGKKYAIF